MTARQCTAARARWTVNAIRVLVVAGVLTAAGLSACGRSPKTPTRTPGGVIATEPVPVAQLPRVVIPARYRIQLTVDPSRDGFSGHAEIDVVLSEKRRDLFIDGQGLNVLAASVRLNARHSVPAHYMQVSKFGVARLIFVDEIPAGKATLVFDYEAPFGKSLSGLYKVVNRGDAYAFTQFEAIDARRVFPSFDEPGFKTPFQLSVTAPSADKVVSNTPVLAMHAKNGTSTTVFQWTRPLPTYLIALAVGPLDIVDGGDVSPNAVRARPLHVRGVTARGEGARIRYTLSMVPKVVSALESYFGIAYPFPKLDILAVPDFGANGMENAGAITFRERHMFVGPDAPLDQKRTSLAILSHEMTHQWFGDLVTPAWWDDTWLNESFATWMEYKVAQTVAPDEQFDTETLRDSFDVMDRDTLPSAREVHQPVHGYGELENAFDAITYQKGAAVLAMFESFVGEDVFKKGIHAYLSKFATRNATAADFIGTIAEVTAAQPHARPENVAINIDAAGNISWNGHPVSSMAALMDRLSHMSAATSPARLSSAFSSFIDQPGVPEIRARLDCEGAVAARLTQAPYTAIGARPVDRSWRVPVCLGVTGHDRYCRLVDRRSEGVLLGAACPVSLMPNDGGTGYYRFSVDAADRDALIKAIASLDPRNQIAILYNLSSGLHAGEVSAADFLRAVGNVAPTARWDVLATADTLLHTLRLQAGLSANDLASYRGFVDRLFSDRMKELGYSAKGRDAPSVALARGEAATLLVSEARDSDAIAMLASSGQSIAQGSKTDLPSELESEALRAAVMKLGAPFAASLLKVYETTDDENLRRDIVYAFAASEDQSVLKSLLQLAPTQRMRIGEIRYLFQFFGEEPAASMTLWNWYKANYAGLVARVSREGMGRAPTALREACDTGARNDLDAFFAPKANELPGLRRPLDLVEQQISRCIAFRQAKSQEIASAFHAAP